MDADTKIRTITAETTDTVLTVITELATTTTTTTEFLPPSITIIPTVTIFADPVTITVAPAPNPQLPQIYARTWKPPSCSVIAEGILAMKHADYVLEEACKCLELRPRTALLHSMADPTTVTFTHTGTVTAYIHESALFTAVSVEWVSQTSTTTSVSPLQPRGICQIGDTYIIPRHSDNNSDRDGNSRPLRSSLQRHQPARSREHGERGRHCKITGRMLRLVSVNEELRIICLGG